MLPSFLGICATPTGGGGCPAYGTVLFNQNEVYPVAEGGASVVYNEYVFPYQNCDVNYVADGSCGQFIDWASASNITYFTNGTPIGTVTLAIVGNDYASNISIADTSGGSWVFYEYDGTNPTTVYQQRFLNRDYVSDGSGSYSTTNYNTDYWPANFVIYEQYQYAEVPSGSNQYFGNGKYEQFYVTSGTNYTSILLGSFNPYGEFITNDGTYDYYWDGMGGYYQV